MPAAVCVFVRVSVNPNLREHASRRLCRHARRRDGWTRPDAPPVSRLPPPRPSRASPRGCWALWTDAAVDTRVLAGGLGGDRTQPRAPLTGEFLIRLPSAAAG